MAITAPGGGANGDEHRARAINCFGQIVGKGQAASGHVLGHQQFKTGFIDRNLALMQLFKFGQVFVNADNIVAKIRKTHT